jgi:phosphoglycerol transferase MdoB-like AlkP superfamily enzyme
MTSKVLLTAVAVVIGAVTWFVTAALILREETAFLPALNLVGVSALVIGYLLGRKRGHLWTFVFPLVMMVAALYLNAARYSYSPEQPQPLEIRSEGKL